MYDYSVMAVAGNFQMKLYILSNGKLICQLDGKQRRYCINGNLIIYSFAIENEMRMQPREKKKLKCRKCGEISY